MYLYYNIFPLITKAFIEVVCFKDHAQDIFAFFVIMETKVITVGRFFAVLEVIKGCAIFGIDQFNIFNLTFSRALSV